MENRTKRYKETFLLFAALVQIFLLIVYLPANSYTIKESFRPAVADSVQKNSQTGNLGSSIIGFLGWLFTIKQIGTVSAASVGCCITTTSGGISSCVDSSSSSDCKSAGSSYTPTSCDSTLQCGPIGTCIDSSSGACTSERKNQCTGQGVSWTKDAMGTGDAAECQSVCCDLKTTTAWIPKSQCTSSSMGGSILNGVDQASCNSRDQYGACVKNSDHTCTMKLGGDCDTSSGGYSFHHGELCTNPSLGTSCKPTGQTTCFGSDVYFLDSCHNLANIYDSSKIISNPGNVPLSDSKWNYWNYTITDSSSLCSPGKNCGVCNYPTTSKCMKFNSATDSSSAEFTTGDYFCGNLTCNVASDSYFPSYELGGREIANNGESWCVYQGHVGQTNFSLGDPSKDIYGSYSGTQYYSSDAVGSYSGVQWCDQGELKTITTVNNEYRWYICGEYIDNRAENQKDWNVTAVNRQNHGLSCLNVSLKTYPSDPSHKTKIDTSQESTIHQFNQQACGNFSAPDAKGNSGKGGADCRLQTINMTYNVLKGDTQDSTFLLDICVPKYPIGFDLNPFLHDSGSGGGDVAQASRSVCNVASFNCTTVWKKAIDGHWWCVDNCQCLTQNFANHMNNLCVSLGDCGGYVNVAGNYTGNYKTFGGSNELYNNNPEGTWYLANPEKNYNTSANGKINSTLPSIFENLLNVSNNPNIILPNSTHPYSNVPWYATLQDLKNLGIADLSTNGNLQSGDAFASFLSNARRSGLGFVASGALAAGAGTAILVHAISLAAGTAFTIPAIGWILGFAALVVLIFTAFGFGATETYTIQFQCNPWQPPTGGDYCTRCGTYGLPCTQYQCESLGSDCFYNNTFSSGVGSPEPSCIYTPRYPPVVNFSSIKGLGEDYNVGTLKDSNGRVLGVRITNKSTLSAGGCFPGGSMLNFSLKTLNTTGNVLETATCAWSYNNSFINDHLPAGGSGGGGFDLNAEGLNYFLQQKYQAYYWNFSAQLPYLSSSPSDFISGKFDVGYNHKGNVTINVVCETPDGEKRGIPQVYKATVCIEDTPDLNPPILSGFYPVNKSYIGVDATKQMVSFNVNTWANCSWNLGADKAYSNSPDTNFIKANGTALGGSCAYANQKDPSMGEICTANLTGLDPTKANNVFIRCNSTTSGIENNPGILYVLKQSQGVLKLDKLKLTYNGNVLPLDSATKTVINAGGDVGCAPGTYNSGTNSCNRIITLNAITSAGADGNGDAICTYKFITPSDYNSGPQVFYTDSSVAGTEHEQIFSGGLNDTKDYNILVNCNDGGGNSATAGALFNFSIRGTGQGPSITRVFNDNIAKKLTAITDEDAKCYYNITRYLCSHDISDPATVAGTAMQSIFATSHYITSPDYEKSKTYYIRCIDAFGIPSPNCFNISIG